MIARGHTKSRRLIIREQSPPLGNLRPTCGQQRRKPQTRKARHAASRPRIGVGQQVFPRTHSGVQRLCRFALSRRQSCRQVAAPYKTSKAPQTAAHFREPNRRISWEERRYSVPVRKNIANSRLTNPLNRDLPAPSGRQQQEKDNAGAETLATLKDEITYLWGAYKIDPYYQDLFWASLAGLPTPACVQCLAKEIEDLYNERACVQRLFANISRREDLFGRIEKLNECLIKCTNKSRDMLENVTMSHTLTSR